MPLMDLLVDWTQLRIEFLSLKIYINRNLQNLKAKRKASRPTTTKNKNRTEYSRTVEKLQRSNISIKIIPEDAKEKGAENIFETIMTDFPKLMSDIKPQIQKPQIIPSQINVKNIIPSHISFKLHKLKDKEKKFLKEVRVKLQLTDKGAKIKVIADLFSDTTHAKESRAIYLNVEKSNNNKNTISLEFCTLGNYPSKLKER